MKQYDVKISHAALSDMEQIYSYIADRLLEPDTAMGQYNRIAEAIQSLNILPERCALVESEPERTQGLRQMPVSYTHLMHDSREDILFTAYDLHSSFVGIRIELLGELVAAVIVKVGRVDIKDKFAVVGSIRLQACLLYTSRCV